MIPLSRILTGQRHAPVVYFVRIGGNVKIGTTVNLRKRMGSLYLPLENVLAVVPGGKDEETAYHECFAASRIQDGPRRELFRIDRHLRNFLHSGIDGRRPQENRPLPVAPAVPRRPFRYFTNCWPPRKVPPHHRPVPLSASPGKPDALT